MTRGLPPMVSFAEIVSTAVRAATHRVNEGSRSNARGAVDNQYQMMRQGAAVMASLAASAPARTGARHRPSA